MSDYSQQALIELGSLTENDVKQVNRCRNDHNRLGFSYQLIFVKVTNTLPHQRPLEIIDEIVAFSSLQTGIDSTAILFYSSTANIKNILLVISIP